MLLIAFFAHALFVGAAWEDQTLAIDSTNSTELNRKFSARVSPDRPEATEDNAGTSDKVLSLSLETIDPEPSPETFKTALDNVRSTSSALAGPGTRRLKNPQSVQGDGVNGRKIPSQSEIDELKKKDRIVRSKFQGFPKDTVAMDEVNNDDDDDDNSMTISLGRDRLTIQPKESTEPETNETEESNKTQLSADMGTSIAVDAEQSVVAPIAIEPSMLANDIEENKDDENADSDESNGSADFSKFAIHAEQAMMAPFVARPFF